MESEPVSFAPTDAPFHRCWQRVRRPSTAIGPHYRTLVQALGGDGVRAINEPSHVACGAPDFIVDHRRVPIGHIECKDIGTNLDRIETDEQLTRYRTGLPNLILTDYLEFRWYAYGELRETARLGRMDSQGRITTDKGSAKSIGALFDAFFSADPPMVTDPRELAERMAAKARLLRDGIGRILRSESRSESLTERPLRNMLAAYRDVLIAGLSDEAFADLQAQTAAYGLFAARCMHMIRRPSRSRASPPFSRTRHRFCATCLAASLALTSTRALPGSSTTSYCCWTGPIWHRSLRILGGAPDGKIR